jgi:hypothetical protein
MTGFEIAALRHNNSMFKLGTPEKYNSIESYNARVKSFKDRNYTTEDPEVLSLLNEGREQFYIKTATRIFEQSHNDIYFNNCPNCTLLARTPYARQCKHCGHSWHETIAANFKVKKILELKLKPNILFIIGKISSGTINIGMRIDLTFLGVSIKPVINSIDFVDHIAEKSTEVSLGVYINNDVEKEYLKTCSLLAIPIIIEK